MAVGKPDFDLNSFGVKYLSKDQVQDFLEIKKRKDQGDVGKDPDTPGLEGKEVSTNEITGHKTVRPKPVKRGGFKGRSMRRVVNGEKVKVPQTEEETTPPEGQVPTSRLNDVQYGKLGEESASEVKESYDMITNSPEWQESINRDAPLTTEEGTEKFDDTPANRALKDRIAARAHKKKLAAEKKKKKNKKKANDIIMDMNIMKLDLMAKVESGQGAVKPDHRQDSPYKFHRAMPHEQPQTRQDSAHESNNPSTRVAETGKVPKGSSQQPVGKNPGMDIAAIDKLTVQQPMKELNEEIETQYKNRGEKFPKTGKAPKDLKRKAAETILKATSLKLDLMKDALDPKAKPQEDLLGNPNTALPKNTRVGQKPPKVIDMGDSEMDYGTGEQFGNPFHGSTTRTTAQGIKNQNKPRYQSTDPGAKYYKNPNAKPKEVKGKNPKSADHTYKSAEETIFKATSLKLDLMKFDGIYIDSTDPSGTYHPKPKAKPAEAKSEKDVKPKKGSGFKGIYLDSTKPKD